MEKKVFKPLYFRCINGNMLIEDKAKVSAWLQRDTAEVTLEQWERRFPELATVKRAIVGFYLVSENLYSEIIEPFEVDIKFNLVYFRCTDGKVFNGVTGFTDAYLNKADVEAKLERRTTAYLWETGPVPIESVRGFYLVHGALYDLILKPFTADV